MNTKLTSTKKMIQACKDSLAKNEYNLRKIRGISMSHSDVETAILYGETILQNGTYSGILMHPRGAVQELMGAFNLLEV